MSELERLRAAYDKLCKDTPNFRNAIIEECARVAEKHLARYDHMEHVAAAIRALKDSGPQV